MRITRKDRIKARVLIWAIRGLTDEKKWIRRKLIVIPYLRKMLSSWFEDGYVRDLALKNHRSFEEVTEMQMANKKPWYRSKGVWGGIVAGLVGAYGLAENILPAFGVTLPPLPPYLLSMIETLGIGGGGLAIYGRLKATREIGGNE